MPDLAEHFDRIARHIPCLEAAARDESAPALVRAAVDLELKAWRLAAELAGHDRMTSDASGTTRNGSERSETEAGRA